MEEQVQPCISKKVVLIKLDGLQSNSRYEAIKTENIEDEATGRVLTITAEPESTKITAPPEGNILASKPAHKAKDTDEVVPAVRAD